MSDFYAKSAEMSNKRKVREKVGVLIRGMEMPKSCYDCYFCRTYDEPNQGYFCIPLFADLHRTDFTRKRIDACPLIEVPTPHGRLIDADALPNYDKPIGKLMMFGGEYVYTQTAINNAPTIIESEE